MKNYILTIQIKVDDNDIKEAREWEKSHGYKYGDDVASLLAGFMTNFRVKEIQSVELDKE